MTPALRQKVFEVDNGLSAVERFSREHDRNRFAEGQTVYQELIPRLAPGPAQQYAFEVDLDKCTGCKGCVTACHNENGLDEDEIWRNVGLLQGGDIASPMTQHVTQACHHCLEPACLAGCPVKAYEKLDSGVVKHLDDQCIGCQYCVLKCPYDVPKFNKKKGIVRKCDMCIHRLEAGEAPACVRGCPNGAIRIRLVDRQEVAGAPEEFVRLPDAPDARYTLPTTRYKTTKKWPWDMASADYFRIQPEHSHMPLVIMLTLTQLSVGAFGIDVLLRRTVEADLLGDLSPARLLVALGVGMLALGASVFHLGRPFYAFRAVIGLMTSWLSREILAFGIFSFLAMIYALCAWPGPVGMALTGGLAGALPFGRALGLLEGAVVVSGVVGILCSVMVYKDTRRPFWDTPWTTAKFILTAGILGVATVLATSVIFAEMRPAISSRHVMEAFGRTLCLLLALMSGIKLAGEAAVFRHLSDKDLTIFKKSAILMTGPLIKATRWRFACGVFGGVMVPLGLALGHGSLDLVTLMGAVVLIFGLSLAGEFLERYLFFRAVVPLKA